MHWREMTDWYGDNCKNSKGKGKLLHGPVSRLHIMTVHCALQIYEVMN